MPSLLQKIKDSFEQSVGEVIFGMEDGAVSIAGLVFGVAFSVDSSQAVVLAGATGAISAAVSMMAGSYLDVSSRRGMAKAKIAHELAEIRYKPHEERQEAVKMLQAVGFNHQQTDGIVRALEENPMAMAEFQKAFELHLGQEEQENPLAHALWMFAADLFAAFVPVVSFIFFPLETARIIALVITSILILALGVGRALIAHWSIVPTALETLGIAVAAAGAGIIVGQFIS